jgi:hypothetical protein
MDALSLLVGATAVGVKVTLRPDGTLNATGPDTPQAAQVVAILKAHKETLQRELARPAPAEPTELATLYDVLCYCSPPVELIEFLQMVDGGQTLTPGLTAWLRRWEGIRAGDPLPALDNLTPGTMGQTDGEAGIPWPFPSTLEQVEAGL